jgi:hypothetical protein
MSKQRGHSFPMPGGGVMRRAPDGNLVYELLPSNVPNPPNIKTPYAPAMPKQDTYKGFIDQYTSDPDYAKKWHEDGRMQRQSVDVREKVGSPMPTRSLEMPTNPADATRTPKEYKPLFPQDDVTPPEMS